MRIRFVLYVAIAAILVTAAGAVAEARKGPFGERQGGNRSCRRGFRGGILTREARAIHLVSRPTAR